MSLRAYWVGNASIVYRYDDPVGSWADISAVFQSVYGSTSSDVIALNDVMTDPLNKDKVWVVGPARPTSSIRPVTEPFRGISYSLTGGLPPGGPGQAWYTPGLPVVGGPTENIREVWVTNSGTVYACGKQGRVYKSIDANTVNPSFSLTTQIVTPSSQEDCYSLHFPTVTKGAVGLFSKVYYTADGGTTWTSADPAGLAAIGAQVFGGVYYEPSQNFIVAVSHGYVVRWQFDSTANAYIWKRTHCFGLLPAQPCTNNSGYDPVGNGIHLTWHTDLAGNLHMWATGNNDQVVYSSDKGITWTTVNTHNFKPDIITGNPTYYGDYTAAHFWLSNKGFLGYYNSPLLGASVAVIDKYDAGTESTSLSNSNAKSIGAIWTVYDPPPVYRLDDCEGTYVTIYTESDLSAYVGQVIYEPTITNPQGITQTPKKCFNVSLSPPVQNLSVVTLPQEPCVWEECESCLPKCYVLTNCDDENDVKVIQIGACNPNAEQIETGIYISSPEFCNNQCFKVEECVCGETGCEGPYVQFPDYLILINQFTTCRQCGGFPEVTDLRPRSVKPGFYTPGCPPDYTVKTSCMYAEQVYDEMVAIRYGISICCDHDVNRWDIKMQLLQLAAIYDPDLCNPPTTPTDPCENV